MVLSGQVRRTRRQHPVPAAGRRAAQRRHRRPGPLADAIAARPVLGLLLPDRGAMPDGRRRGTRLAQQQLFGAVLGMLAELAGTAPVLLVLEDMHWADRSTRDLLTFLSRVLHRERVAVVATYRTDDLHRRHPLRAGGGGAAPAAQRDRDRAGAAAATRTWRSTWPRWRTARWTRPRCTGIVARAEGNPYYAEELLAAVGVRLRLLPGRAGRTAAGPAASGCPPRRQQVLRAAAVAGRRVEDDMRPGGLRPGRSRSTRRRSGRPSRTSCWCPTARRATPSGTR